MFRTPAFIALFGAATAIAAALPATAQTLRFGAGQQGSQNYGVNAALAAAIAERTGIDTTVQSFGGPIAYLPLLNAGDLDIAAVVTPDLGDAIRGQGPFAGMAQSDLRIVAALLPSPVALMVAADSGIATIADLEDRRVAWGLPSQASLQPYVLGALANGGLTEADIVPVPVSGVREGVQALIDGSVDATLFALRGGAVLEADSALNGIAWLPLSDDPDAIARMQAVAPEAYVLTVSAKDGVTGIGADLMVMAYDYVLVTRTGADDGAITAVAEMLRDHVAEIAASLDILSTMTDATVARSYDLPYHPASAAVFAAQ